MVIKDKRLIDTNNSEKLANFILQVEIDNATK